MHLSALMFFYTLFVKINYIPYSLNRKNWLCYALDNMIEFQNIYNNILFVFYNSMVYNILVVLYNNISYNMVCNIRVVFYNNILPFILLLLDVNTSTILYSIMLKMWIKRIYCYWLWNNKYVLYIWKVVLYYLSMKWWI